MVDEAILARDGRVILPAAGRSSRELTEVSTWDDAEDNLEAFVAALFERGTSRRARARTTAVLVHRSDNTYNRNAISVSTPGRRGRSLDERHLGYLYDAFLRKVGMTNLPDLIGFAGGEVECTVVVEKSEQIWVDLPEPDVLGEAVRTFLTARGFEASGAPRPDDITPKLRTHTKPNADTAQALFLLSQYEADAIPVTGVRLTTERYGGTPGRSLQVRDEATGRPLGSWVDGWLSLHDERDRDTVRALLAGKGIAVNDPVTDPVVRDDGSWPADVPPNVRAQTRAGGLDLRTIEQASDETFAIFNPTSNVLWVEDSRLVAPAVRFMHRQGFDIARIGVPRRPWALDSEVPYRHRYDPDKPWRDPNDSHTPKLLRSTGALLPDGVLSGRDVHWLTQSPMPDKSGASFLLLEQYVPERALLFPVHTLTGNAGECRLCGSSAALFTTPICTGVLAYCHTCLAAASTGLVTDRARAGEALRALSDLEFDGQPMLAAQLDSLHVNPTAPVEANTIDRMVVLRFGIIRKGVAWTLMLEAAGFAEHGLRTSRGTLIRSRDGHLCLSLRERVVCDFLHLHDIAHEREPLYPTDPDYNRHGLRRADWLLHDGTLVELWGLPNDPQYAAKMTEKRLLAERHQLPLLEISDENLPMLREVFSPWMRPGVESPWQWSPALVVSPAPPKAPTKPARGDGRGRNAFNTQTQRDRVDRCAEAVRLQQSGLTRTQIATQLGVGTDAVKMLLRDGKFYADPRSDDARAALAEAAADARQRGLTRAEFARQAGTSMPKSQEAWRDAAIVYEDVVPFDD